jgi:hypothetical protein
MSAAAASPSRDPRSRHEGGFDRWSRDSRAGWLLLGRASEYAPYVLAEDQSVWVWDARERIWMRLPGDEATAMLREHHRALNRLRRALLVVPLLSGESGVEREAARLALQRIGVAIVEEWNEGLPADGAPRGAAWFDHPAAVYLAVTRDCRCHFAERERVPFDASMFAALVASAREDFRTGRRALPPRLRPEDMVLLQSQIEPAAVEPPKPIESNYIGQLRESLMREFQREDAEAAEHLRRRRQMVLLSGSLAVSLAVILAFVGIS